MIQGIFKADSNIGEIEFEYKENKTWAYITVYKDGNKIHHSEQYFDTWENYDMFEETNKEITIYRLNYKLIVDKSTIQPIDKFTEYHKYLCGYDEINVQSYVNIVAGYNEDNAKAIFVNHVKANMGDRGCMLIEDNVVVIDLDEVKEIK